VTKTSFQTTPDGEQRFRHLSIKLGFLLQELNREETFEGDGSGNSLSFEGDVTESDTGKTYKVFINVDEDDEGTKTGFSSNNIADEDDLLSRMRRMIAYFASKVSASGLERVNSRYGLVSEQDEPQGKC
jgi:hypothetical protein